jgi:hypothetical protein
MNHPVSHLVSRCERRRDERGSITPFVVIVSLGILMLAALVVDGGRQLNAHGRAIAYAEEAARAGAQEVDVADPRLDLVPALALQAAREYCQRAKAEDSQLSRCDPHLATVHGPAGTFHAIKVDTEIDLDAILLGIVGRHQLTAGGHAEARPVSGISKPDTGKLATLPPPSVGLPSDAPPSTAQPTPPEITVPPCPTPTGKHPKKPTPTPTPTPSVTPTGGPTQAPCEP